MLGGIIALRGFDYQATVILDCLFDHFEQHGLSARVRPEGEDDLELRWVGSNNLPCQQFIQIKKPREDNSFAPTDDAWSLVEVAKTLIPGTLRNLKDNTHEQLWLLGDGVDSAVADLISAGQSAPTKAPNSYWRVVHLLARESVLKVVTLSKEDRSTVVYWRSPTNLLQIPDTACGELVSAFQQCVVDFSDKDKLVQEYSDQVRRHHTFLPGILGRVKILPKYGSEEAVAQRVHKRLKNEYRLDASVVKDTLFRNLRGFINDISKQIGRDFDKEEFELELRSVWPTMMPVRNLPILDEDHISRPALSSLFTTDWSGKGLEVLGVSGAGKTMLAAEVGQQSKDTAPDRHVFYVEATPDTELRDVLVGIAFNLRRVGIEQPFTIAVESSAASDTILANTARAMSVLPSDVLLLVDLVQGRCSDGFAHELAAFIRHLNSEVCRVAVLGQESALRHLSALERKQLGVRRVDVPGLNFDEFCTLVSRRHSNPDNAILNEIFRKITAGRSAGLYAKLARTLAEATSVEKMQELSQLPADEILGQAEREKFTSVSNDARSAAEKLVCFALPFGKAEAEVVFPKDNTGAAIHELSSLGLLRETGDGGYEMHEIVRAGLEQGIAHDKRQLAHKELSAYYAARGEIVTRIYHLEQAGLTDEAYRCARETFLKGESWRRLTGLVTKHKLVTADEVLGVIASPIKIEGAYLFADILLELNPSFDFQQILSVLKQSPQRFLDDFNWAMALAEASLAIAPSCLHELILFCLEIVGEPDRRESGLGAILIGARRHGCTVGTDTLELFDASTTDVKQLLVSFLLAHRRREALARAFAFIEENQELDSGSGRRSPRYNYTLQDQNESIEFLASLPAVDDHIILGQRSPCLGALTSLIWNNRYSLNSHCVDLLESGGGEFDVQKNAIRVLAFLAEPRLCSLCDVLSHEEDNPIRGFAALAPTMVPTLINPIRYETTLFNPELDIQNRAVSLSLLASTGADLDVLYDRVRKIEGDNSQHKLWGFFFLQLAVMSPFQAAVPLLEKELWSSNGRSLNIFSGLLTSLAQLPGPAITELLIKALSHPDSSVRTMAALGLGGKRSKAALADLQNCLRSEESPALGIQLAVAIIASGAKAVSDLDGAQHETEALSLWRCVLAARTRDTSYASSLVSFACDTNANWQLRRAAINAAGFLPFETALSQMLPILQVRSPLSIDDHISLYTHGMFSWLLLEESKSLLPRFMGGRKRFVGIVGDIHNDSKEGLIDSRGIPSGKDAADWLYDRLIHHGWPTDCGAPDKVINELHIPLLHSAIYRALHRTGRSDLIKQELAKADHIWSATKCIMELRRAGVAEGDTTEKIIALASNSPVGGDPRLEVVIGNILRTKTVPKTVKKEDDSSTKAPVGSSMSYDEAVAVLNGDISDSQSPITLKGLTGDQFKDLVRRASPINDRHKYEERYVPGISFNREGHTVAHRQQTSRGNTKPAGTWIRPAIVAANQFGVEISWHEDLLASPYSDGYADKLIACLSAAGDSQLFYDVLYQTPHLLLPHICTYQTRLLLVDFIDDRLITFLSMYASSGTGELFEGLCAFCALIDSPTVDPTLSILFTRWTDRFKHKSINEVRQVSHHWWRAFRSLTNHPRFVHIRNWFSLLSPVIHAPLPWYHKQDVTRVLERDSRFYVQLEPLLFKSQDWEHFAESEIERLQEAAERLFREVELN